VITIFINGVEVTMAPAARIATGGAVRGSALSITWNESRQQYNCIMEIDAR
jgi:hypothetical protein